MSMTQAMTQMISKPSPYLVATAKADANDANDAKIPLLGGRAGRIRGERSIMNDRARIGSRAQSRWASMANRAAAF